MAYKWNRKESKISIMCSKFATSFDTFLTKNTKITDMSLIYRQTMVAIVKKQCHSENLSTITPQ